MKRVTWLYVACCIALTAGCARKEGKVVARVGSETITTADLKAELNRMRRPPTERDVKRVLNKLITDAAFVAEAKKRGIDRRPEFVREVENYKKRLLMKLLNQEIMKSEARKTISEKELREYYEKNKNFYRARKTFVINHITAASEKLAKKIIKQWKKAKKADLRQIAKKLMQESPGKINITEREYVEVPSRKYGAEFSKELEKLHNGDVSKIIRGRDGRWHVVQVVSRRDIPERSFEQVKNNIKMRLMAQRRSAASTKFREELRKNYKPKIYDTILQEFIKNIAKAREKAPFTLPGLGKKKPPAARTPGVEKTPKKVIPGTPPSPPGPGRPLPSPRKGKEAPAPQK